MKRKKRLNISIDINESLFFPPFLFKICQFFNNLFPYSIILSTTLDIVRPSLIIPAFTPMDFSYFDNSKRKNINEKKSFIDYRSIVTCS